MKCNTGNSRITKKAEENYNEDEDKLREYYENTHNEFSEDLPNVHSSVISRKEDIDGIPYLVVEDDHSEKNEERTNENDNAMTSSTENLRKNKNPSEKDKCKKKIDDENIKKKFSRIEDIVRHLITRAAGRTSNDENHDCGSKQNQMNNGAYRSVKYVKTKEDPMKIGDSNKIPLLEIIPNSVHPMLIMLLTLICIIIHEILNFNNVNDTNGESNKSRNKMEIAIHLFLQNIETVKQTFERLLERICGYGMTRISETKSLSSSNGKYKTKMDSEGIEEVIKKDYMSNGSINGDYCCLRSINLSLNNLGLNYEEEYYNKCNWKGALICRFPRIIFAEKQSEEIKLNFQNNTNKCQIQKLLWSREDNRNGWGIINLDSQQQYMKEDLTESSGIMDKYLLFNNQMRCFKNTSGDQHASKIHIDTRYLDEYFNLMFEKVDNFILEIVDDHYSKYSSSNITNDGECSPMFVQRFFRILEETLRLKTTMEKKQKQSKVSTEFATTHNSRYLTRNLQCFNKCYLMVQNKFLSNDKSFLKTVWNTSFIFQRIGCATYKNYESKSKMDQVYDKENYFEERNSNENELVCRPFDCIPEIKIFVFPKISISGQVMLGFIMLNLCFCILHMFKRFLHQVCKIKNIVDYLFPNNCKKCIRICFLSTTMIYGREFAEDILLCNEVILLVEKCSEIVNQTSERFYITKSGDVPTTIIEAKISSYLYSLKTAKFFQLLEKIIINLLKHISLIIHCKRNCVKETNSQEVNDKPLPNLITFTNTLSEDEEIDDGESELSFMIIYILLKDKINGLYYFIKQYLLFNICQIYIGKQKETESSLKEVFLICDFDESNKEIYSRILRPIPETGARSDYADGYSDSRSNDARNNPVSYLIPESCRNQENTRPNSEDFNIPLRETISIDYDRIRNEYSILIPEEGRVENEIGNCGQIAIDHDVLHPEAITPVPESSGNNSNEYESTENQHLQADGTTESRNNTDLEI